MAKQKENNMTSDPNCICQGNWRQLVKESDDLSGKRYVGPDGKKYTFVGVLNGSDDYYYCLVTRKGRMALASCAGSLETNGFIEIGGWGQ